MNKTRLYRGLGSICLAIAVLFSVAASVATAWAGKVDELLGTSKTGIERSLDPADYRYQSDFSNPSDLIAAEIAYATRVSAEGSVALKGQPAIDGSKVTLFGMRSGSKMQFGGSMGELIEASQAVTLSEALTKEGFSVNPEMVRFYQDREATYAPTKGSGGNVISSYEGQGAEIGEVPVSELSASLLGDYKDAAIIVFGRDAGESCCFYPRRKRPEQAGRVHGTPRPATSCPSPTTSAISSTGSRSRASGRSSCCSTPAPPWRSRSSSRTRRWTPSSGSATPAATAPTASRSCCAAPCCPPATCPTPGRSTPRSLRPRRTTASMSLTTPTTSRRPTTTACARAGIWWSWRGSTRAISITRPATSTPWPTRATPPRPPRARAWTARPGIMTRKSAIPSATASRARPSPRRSPPPISTGAARPNPP